MVSKEDMKYIAELCKLKFSDDELEDLTATFSKILERVDKLKKLDVEGVNPTYFVNPKINPLREDIVDEGLLREEALKNAPEEQYGYFKLLKVMD